LVDGLVSFAPDVVKKFRFISRYGIEEMCGGMSREEWDGTDDGLEEFMY
jgi:hypothetical protein